MAEPEMKTDSESKVRYVLSGQPTGLTALAQAVREYDLETIQNCKEDIDTLLVFVSTSRVCPYRVEAEPKCPEGRSLLCSSLSFSNRVLYIASTAT